MIKTLIKYVIFAAVILAIGQIRVGNDTIGAQFHKQLNMVLAWGQKRLEKNNIQAKIAPPAFLNSWLGKKKAGRPTSILQPELKKGPIHPDKITEEITKADREALLRILEQ